MDRAPRREKLQAQEPEPERTGEDTHARIQELEAKSGRGLWPLVAFLAVSLWARTGFVFLPAVPPGWKSFLGRPPPPAWVSAAFVLYVFSAMVLSLTRMAGEGSPGNGYRHVGYLVAFYGFFHVSEGLGDGFWAVLAGGLAVLTLEWYRNRLYYRALIREETEKGGLGAGE